MADMLNWCKMGFMAAGSLYEAQGSAQIHSIGLIGWDECHLGQLLVQTGVKGTSTQSNPQTGTDCDGHLSVTVHQSDCCSPSEVLCWVNQIHEHTGTQLVEIC